MSLFISTMTSIDWGYIHWIRDAIVEYTQRHPEKIDHCNTLVREMFSDKCTVCRRLIISEKLKEIVINEDRTGPNFWED